MKRVHYYLASLSVLTAFAIANAETPETITDINQAWVHLFDDKAMQDRVLIIKGNENITDMNKAITEDGQKGFGDKASSARYQIPKGWKLVLSDDNGYKDSMVVLKGTGKVEEEPDFGSSSDHTSSCRWSQAPQ